MELMDHQDIPALDIVKVDKIYTQWQRSGKLKDIAKNIFHPEKKEIRALDQLSLQVGRGEFVAYAGANGAGKSTTIKILSGILQPTSGIVKVLGVNPAKDRVRLMSRIGVLFGQRTELWWDHPVITSYEWKKKVWNIDEKTYRKNLDMVTELLGLTDITGTFARELSLGQRMRADLGMLLLHSPEVIFLDEPTLGLDVLAKRRMIEFLKVLNRENGTTIVVTSHDMDDLEEMARRIILLSKGQIAFDGSFQKLRQVNQGAERIIITANTAPKKIPGLSFVESGDGRFEYLFSKSEIAVNEVLRRISDLEGITDVEMKHETMEEVIAKLYMQM